MGEEYGEENPFPFFCSFGDPELVRAVREGRQKEFEAFTWQGEVPDPQAEETFASAKLSWSWPEGTPRAGLRRLYRDLLAARREWPALRDFENRSARLLPGRTGRSSSWSAAAGSMRALFNLGDRPAPTPGGRRRRACRCYCARRPPRTAGAAAKTGRPTELDPFEFVVLGPPSWRAFPGRQ